MPFELDEGPFTSRDLVWEKYREAEFFLSEMEKLTDIDASVEGEFKSDNVFRYCFSGFLNAAYTIDSFFRKMNIAPDGLFEDPDLQRLHEFLKQHLRASTAHLEAAKDLQYEVSEMLSLRVSDYLSEGERRISLDKIPDKVERFLVEKEVTTEGSVTVTELLRVYVNSLEVRLTRWKEPPDNFGIIVVTETWEKTED